MACVEPQWKIALLFKAGLPTRLLVGNVAPAVDGNGGARAPEGLYAVLLDHRLAE